MEPMERWADRYQGQGAGECNELQPQERSARSLVEDIRGVPRPLQQPSLELIDVPAVLVAHPTAPLLGCTMLRQSWLQTIITLKGNFISNL